MPLTPPDAPSDGNVVHAVLGSLAALLMAAGAWILRKTGKAPRPKSVSEREYEFLKTEMEEKFKRDLQPIKDSLDRLSSAFIVNNAAVQQNADQMERLSRAHSSEASSLRGDMQEMRGELGQLILRVARQGGVLRGLEERFNAE